MHKLTLFRQKGLQKMQEPYILRLVDFLYKKERQPMGKNILDEQSFKNIDDQTDLFIKRFRTMDSFQFKIKNFRLITVDCQHDFCNRTTHRPFKTGRT